MSRRNYTVLFSAGLAAALAACHPNTPTTSVSTLSYQVQSAGNPTTDAARLPSAQPAPRDIAAPAELSPNDPRRLLDMP